MERRRVACIAALILALPTALASSGLVATELVLAGATRVEGDASALFFVAQRDGFSWETRADSATLLREHASFVAADRPLHGGYQFFKVDDWRTETVELGPLTLASLGTLAGGALLVSAQPTALRAVSEGIVEIKAVADPLLVQGNPADASTDGGEGGELAERFDGDFLLMTFSEGVFTLTGDLTLRMYGPGYRLATDDGSSEMQTGEYETSRTLVLAQGNQERHTLTLHNAVLQVRASEPITLLSQFPTVAIDGTVKAPRAQGALALDGGILAPAAENEPLLFTGAATLALSPSNGWIAASAPGAGIASAGRALAPQGPPIVALGAASVLALALLGLALVVIGRRRARDRDDLALALLAMEERRWEDALPRLARVARRDPHNATVLVDRALCLEQVGRFEEAAKAFETALRAAPRHAEAHFYYARTLAKMREREAARAHLEEALERDPRLAEMARAESVLRGL
ncbi:MAG TPA: tetratricopeptide repeat protein [Candidatus Thermoplasmatota archaeon]|nr:tetratricopeptide repeat protein [Candidatus Thermoplasmatota archaeon]